jgi:hypothetical protein
MLFAFLICNTSKLGYCIVNDTLASVSGISPSSD